MTKTMTHARRVGRWPSAHSGSGVGPHRPVAVHHVQSQVRTGGQKLMVDVRVPAVGQPPQGWVILARQAGGSLSPQELALLDTLHRAGLATLTAGLLTPVEAADPAAAFDTALLGVRFVAALSTLVELSRITAISRPSQSLVAYVYSALKTET